MFEELNAEQKEAVETINGPVRIIAGAGAGKTKTLVSRVANMLQKGISAAAVCKWQKGQTLPSIDNLLILSVIWNVRMDDLIVKQVS